MILNEFSNLNDSKILIIYILMRSTFFSLEAFIFLGNYYWKK